MKEMTSYQHIIIINLHHLKKEAAPNIFCMDCHSLGFGTVVLENINNKINSILCSRSITLTPFTSCGMWAGTTVSDVGWDDGFDPGTTVSILGRRFGNHPKTMVSTKPSPFEKWPQN